MKSVALSLLGLASLASLATARTDLEGCVSSEIIIEKYYASYLWYDPDNGEICSFLDCGGGRAPPKTTQPGCPQYSGTATLTPDYIEGWGPNGKQAASTSTVASTASTDTVITSATQTSEASDSSSFSSSSPSATQTADSMITGVASGLSAVATSLKLPTSSTSAGNATSTSAAATSSSTFNAATTLASNVGVMAVMAAMIGAMEMDLNLDN
ncbi:unnamed protein product [Penicillium glandicola]